MQLEFYGIYGISREDFATQEEVKKFDPVSKVRDDQEMQQVLKMYQFAKIKLNVYSTLVLTVLASDGGIQNRSGNLHG